MKAYLSLLGLLALTVLTSCFHLGIWNDVLSYVFAFIKTMIILKIFMKWDKNFESSKIYFLLGGMTLILMIVGILDDLLLRVP